MAKKRIIGSIFIKDNIAVQSYGYGKYRPLGSPIIIAENLARWMVDEILINFIDLTKKNTKPNYQLIKKISAVVAGTPIIYGGAINSLDVACKVIDSGADRVIIDNLFNEKFNEINKISRVIGRQAMVFSLPFMSDLKSGDINFYHFNYISKKITSISDFIENNSFDDFSEIVLIDVMSDGGISSYNDEILNYFSDFQKHRLVCMGGISSINRVKKILLKKNCDAVAIGNSLNFTENRIFKIKSEISNQINIRF